MGFLSIQAQDFIEDTILLERASPILKFLSIQAQDFIEDCSAPVSDLTDVIPEHSSSGLH